MVLPHHPRLLMAASSKNSSSLHRFMLLLKVVHLILVGDHSLNHSSTYLNGWENGFCLEISFLYLSANFHQIRVLVTGVDVPRPSAHQTFAFRFIIYKVWYTVMNDVYFQ